MYHLTTTQATRLYDLALRGDALAVSSITVYEFRNGMTPANETLCEQVLSSMTVVPFDDNAARTASVIYQTLKSQHTLIDIADILIAATAIAHHLPIATLNVRHFQRIADITFVTP